MKRRGKSSPVLRRLSSLANPIRCKAKKGAALTGSEDCPSFNPGRPHEVQDNLNPREMIAIPPQAGNKTRLIVYPSFIIQSAVSSEQSAKIYGEAKKNQKNKIW